MKRNHIHFAPGEPGDGQVISGELLILSVHCARNDHGIEIVIGNGNPT